MNETNDLAAKKGIRSAICAIIVNSCLVVTKACAGIFGNSYALIADAVESASDVMSSVVIIIGLKLARKPADHNHPYGHGKFEPMATVIVATTLMLAAIAIGIKSAEEIITPHHAPAPYTLIVLLSVIVIKEWLFRRTVKIGHSINSTAVTADAWHQRSDAITSAAAFVGISIALIGGKGYESADDFAAFLAAGIIMFNAIVLFKPALYELLDSAPNPLIAETIRKTALSIPGVLGTHKCHVRKVGFDYFADLDVLCDPNTTIRDGHQIAHEVGAAVHKAIPAMAKVLVHMEPVDDYGRRSDCTIGT